MRYEEHIKEFSELFLREAIIEPDDFPNVELYADQAAQFISEKLSIYAKDPLLTKSMIANYVKQDLIPSPESRKYDKSQLIMREMILCLKTTFQMDDIKAIMKPFVENYESEFEEKVDFVGLYENFVPDFKAQRKRIADGILEDMEAIKERNRDIDAEEDDTPELFLLLLSIAMKVDTAMYIGKNLLRTYFETDQKVEKAQKKAANKKAAKK
jgi:DNA-binding transcriptional MerR regulator